MSDTTAIDFNTTPCLSGPVEYGESGWQWWVHHSGLDGPAMHYRTNRQGDGLWGEVHNGPDGTSEWVQHAGTADWSPDAGERAAKASIARHFKLNWAPEED